ncbi:MAG: hypothetical protein E7293_10365 [Lachnospiraceae bacterium]|nr:hypothetical protein [Lachnospiraceae bacterium]
MKIARDKIVSRILFWGAILILILYPLRHVGVGVDLWDAGYNYANFRYPGSEYMDSMWYYATWLANQVGTFLTRLPFAGTMLGMNIYTGLIVSLMAVISWLFAVKKIGVPGWVAFIGEIMAISLCWAPTAVLYNYLTYLLLLVGTIFLYQGLVKEKRSYLIVAGAVLGCNVAVRFSNLPQMALIIAVWSNGLIHRKKFSVVLKQTGFCVLGYVAAVAAYLLLVTGLYGTSDYIEGIRRLFGMTETAEDYAPTYMLKTLFDTYYESTYWLKRYALAVVGEFALLLVLPGKFEKIKKGLIIVLTLTVTGWLIEKGFFYPDYHTYQAIFHPCVTVFILLLLLAGWQLVSRSATREEKLMAVIMMVTLLITSLGSNNAVYSSINNLFLVFPWFMGVLWKFLKEKKIWYFPFQVLMSVTVLLLLVLSLRFGRTFVYEQATGGRNMDTVVEDVAVLKGIKTSKQKAMELTDLYRYLKEHDLIGRECLLYGEIPAVAYYMELPPAINVWSDLRSYTYETMREDLEQLSVQTAAGKRPVIILEAAVQDYLEGSASAQEVFLDGTAADKMGLITEFMKEHSYQLAYSNEKYVVYF